MSGRKRAAAPREIDDAAETPAGGKPRSRRSLTRVKAFTESHVLVFPNNGTGKDHVALTVKRGWSMRKLRDEAWKALGYGDPSEHIRLFALTSKNRGREVFDITTLSPQDELVLTAGEDLVPYKLLACGSAGTGQLGLEERVVRETYTSPNLAFDLPQLVPRMTGKSVVQVACGAEHTLYRCESGLLYASGNNQYGQLGNAKRKKSEPPSAAPVFKPRRVNIPDCFVASFIAAGADHSLALVRNLSDGRQTELFAWGCGDHGRLGLGRGFDVQDDGRKTVRSRFKNEFSPLPVIAVRALRLAQVAAGGQSSFAVTEEGRLFSWGRAHRGQLGHVVEDLEGAEASDAAKGSGAGRPRADTGSEWSSEDVRRSLREHERPLFITDAAEARKSAEDFRPGSLAAMFTMSEGDAKTHAVAKKSREFMEASQYTVAALKTPFPGPVLSTVPIADEPDAPPRERGSRRRLLGSIADALQRDLGLKETPVQRFVVADTMDVPFPREVVALRGRRVLAVAAGERHAACITSSLEGAGMQVFTWGAGPFGELGFSPCDVAEDDVASVGATVLRGARPEYVVKDSSGEVKATFGADAQGTPLSGSLMVSNGVARLAWCGIPREVETLREHRIVQIACGLHHTLFLSHDAYILASGDARVGSLGLTEHDVAGDGDRDPLAPPCMCVYTPTRLASHAIAKVGAMQVCAGPVSSACVTGKGVPFVWGQARGGRLGLGSEAAQATPQEMDIASDQLISSVAMGGSARGDVGHTVFLSLQYRKGYPSAAVIKQRAVACLPMPGDPSRYRAQSTTVPAGAIIGCCAAERTDGDAYEPEEVDEGTEGSCSVM